MAVLAVVLVFGIVFLTVLYSVNKKKTHAKPDKGLPLQKLPGVPLWSLFLMWWRYTSFVKHIGSLNRICQLRLGKFRMTIINDYKLGKELFQNPVFCGKDISEIVDAFYHGSYGIGNAHGTEWKKQLTFVKQQLKEFGLETQTMETNIQNEINDVLQSWRDTKGKRFSPNHSFYLPILNALWIIHHSLRGEGIYARQSTRPAPPSGFKKVFDFPCILLASSKLSHDLTLSFARWIPIFHEVLPFFKAIEDLRTHFQTIIDARKSAVTMSGAPTNLVDAYLKEAKQTTDPNSGFYGIEGNLNLLTIMTDFFIAGGDTTANEMAWSMFHLIRNPEVQRKIRQEIHRVVGPNRRPSIQDRQKYVK